MQKKLIHEIRAVKNKKEIANIIAAQRISERVLHDVLKQLKTKVTESAIAEFITKRFIKYSAPVLAFLPIVAFRKNTADIHHKPNKTKLKAGDTIMLDFGCAVNHYCSDVTRTYFWGEPNSKQKKIYLTVLEAQNRAIKKLEKGERRANVIDKTARNFLNKKFKIKNLISSKTEGFPHGLGHGVGAVIHEWPNLKPKSEDVIPIGSVVTIEPGLYFKGFGGVRIEDMVLITENGCKNLTNIPKDLKSVILKTL